MSNSVGNIKKFSSTSLCQQNEKHRKCSEKRGLSELNLKKLKIVGINS